MITVKFEGFLKLHTKVILRKIIISKPNVKRGMLDKFYIVEYFK